MLQFNLIGANSLDNLEVRLGLSDDEENQIMSEPGMAFTAQTPQGPVNLIVTEVEEEEVDEDDVVLEDAPPGSPGHARRRPRWADTPA